MATKPDLTKRLYEYLRKVAFSEKENKWVPRKRLKTLAYGNGYSQNQVWDAIKELDDMFDVACASEGGETCYRFYVLTNAEKKKMKEDRDWFNSL